MSIFRPLTCRWSSRGAAGVLALVLPILALRGEPPPRPASFLDAFRDTKESAVTFRDVRFASAVGAVSGYLARPDTTERLPALVLLSDEGTLTDWTKANVRDLASIGYVVLAVDLGEARRIAARTASPAAEVQERILAATSATVRWLRRRADVLPAQVGVAGWGWGSSQALALAAATPLQACVLCDGPVTTDEATIAGLRGTPLLLVYGGKQAGVTEKLPALRKALTAAGVPLKIAVHPGAAPGFMGPPRSKAYLHRAAERAWVEMYEFLGKHVEDAAPHAAASPVSGDEKPIATIADLMKAVNQPAGVRGTLAAALAKEPGTPRAWQRVRAHAALVAEAGRLLQRHTPRKGDRRDWQRQARAFTAAAEAVVAGADHHDYTVARRGLLDLAASCAACHERHR